MAERQIQRPPPPVAQAWTPRILQSADTHINIIKLARLFYLIFMLLRQWYSHRDEVIMKGTLHFRKCIFAIIMSTYHRYGILHKYVSLTSVCPPVLSCTRLRDIEAVTANVWKNELIKLQSPSAMSSCSHIKHKMTSLDHVISCQDHKNIKTIV